MVKDFESKVALSEKTVFDDELDILKKYTYHLLTSDQKRK